ncbi:TRAP transporter small permease [Chloroflexota bacterium]
MKLISYLSGLAKGMNYVAMVVLVALMALTVVDVSLRYLFSKPLIGATELTEMMMASLAFMALAWTAVQHGHLKVDLLMSRLSPRVQASADSITLVAGLVTCVIISLYTFKEGLKVMHKGIGSSLLEVPVFPIYFIIAFGTAILCLIMLTQIMENIVKAVKGPSPEVEKSEREKIAEAVSEVIGE